MIIDTTGIVVESPAHFALPTVSAIYQPFFGDINQSL
jgi:hypothetical protein